MSRQYQIISADPPWSYDNPDSLYEPDIQDIPSDAWTARENCPMV
jgi:hypothetical protein